MSDIVTPMVKQYNKIKQAHPDHILFFRLGDFYEMFNEDAKIASKILDIVLTRKKVGKNKYLPLAGIPYHSADNYIAKLIKSGYKVAICEQVENPKLAKDIVKREVIRVISPGTVVESNILEEKSNNYLISIYRENGVWGLTSLEFSTGAFYVTEFNSLTATKEMLNELFRIAPAELLLPEEIKTNSDLMKEIKSNLNTFITFREDLFYDISEGRELLHKHFGVHNLSGFGCESLTSALGAAASIISYVNETQKTLLTHINKMTYYSINEFMILDHTTQRSLELIHPIHPENKEATLLAVIDNTITPMGARLLKNWILQPLIKKEQINKRLDAVEELIKDVAIKIDIAKGLKGITDLERIIARINCNRANGRDLIALKLSLERVPFIINTLKKSNNSFLIERTNDCPNLSEVIKLIDNSIVEEPSISIKEGNLIKNGFNPELDELRSITTDSKSWIAKLREQEIKRTGISSLKIGFNKVFGYYIEITNPHKNLVPSDYIRKQTLTNAERYITPELKEKEEIILTADEKICELEFNLFQEISKRIINFTKEIQKTSEIVATLDCLNSSAETAIKHNYTKPDIMDDGIIDIKDGRHPVLETIELDTNFVPNDAYLDSNSHQILIITGPNMAGKSTYIRQVALITLLAHIGSFVPASKASITTVDRIFTRVGAMDYIAKGQSTFLVEMNETANILNNATNKSLVILDEIGRGTSTYDGVSIAWSVIEYLHNSKKCQPKTLFATHYHELVELENSLERVKNYHTEVIEKEDEITFLYKILPGGTDHSYGIYAAKLAGIPSSAIERAKEILFDLECGETPIKKSDEKKKAKLKKDAQFQLTFFSALPNSIIEKLKNIDIDSLRPVDALNLLNQLIEESKKL